MKLPVHRFTDFGTALCFGVVGVLSTGGGIGQVGGQAPSDLIRFLTYQSDRPNKTEVLSGLFSCGMMSEAADRAAAASLAGLGDAAVPEIQASLGGFPMNSTWLLLAYARIKGRAGYPWLRSIGRDPAAQLRCDPDQAMALALGLTSYVSGARPPGTAIHCGRGEEPRDVLDRLILAWERNDRPQFESSLGPDARLALDALLKGRGWDAVRSEFWQGISSEDVAIGYRFVISGRWAQPEETLDHRDPGDVKQEIGNFDVDTLLTDGAGDKCGTQPIRFLGARSRKGTGVRYLVNDRDLTNLLRSIAVCGSRGS